MIDKNKLAIYPEWKGPLLMQNYDIRTSTNVCRIEYRNDKQRVGIDLADKQMSQLDYYGINLALLSVLNGKPIKHSLGTRLGWKWSRFKHLFSRRRYAKIF